MLNNRFVDTQSILFSSFSQMGHNELQLYFGIDHFSYVMFLDCVDGCYKPDSIAHFKFGKPCLFCNQTSSIEMTSCKALESHINEIFHYLVEQPGMRLHWLYLNHEKGEE